MKTSSSNWLVPDAPTTAVEIAGNRVTVVGLSKGAAGPVVQGWATEPLAPGLVVPSLTERNITDADAVSRALERAIARADVKAKRVALVIPDLAAKVSIVPFETVPARADDLQQLVAWQVRKAVPFKLEDGQMSYVPGAPHGAAGRNYVVTLARRDVIREYEGVCEAAGAHAGAVDLASFNVINAVESTPSSSQGDWLLVHATNEAQTLAIVRGNTLMFFRSRPVDDEEGLPDLVHQTAMYYEDRLQGAAFERVVLAGGAAWQGDAVRQGLAGRVSAPVTSIEPRQIAGFAGRGFDDLQPEAADALLAPLGILLRERAGAEA